MYAISVNVCHFRTRGTHRYDTWRLETPRKRYHRVYYSQQSDAGQQLDFQAYLSLLDNKVYDDHVTI